ncbi:MAG: AgmX/PglI C-terminal domain-containing protein [Gammaproteobacteria bacterium]|nr:AgmX/PglI C-terminal domain-containing protein [Gammaproteobacteria bacterium]
MDEGDTVKPDYSDDELALRTQVEGSERALEDLERDLRDVDRELEQLSVNNQKFEVLGDVCRSLEELENLGGESLFWKDGDSDRAAYISQAREKIHDFGESIIKVESRRREIVARIGDQNYELDCLHYDLSEAIEREESRRNEWLVERAADEVPVRPVVMPWGRGYEEDKRYRKSLASSVLTSFVLAILVGSIAIPIKDRPKELELPERMAKLVREQLPPPPEPERIVEPEIDEEIPEPEPELAEEVEPSETAEVEQAPQLAAADEPDIKEQVKSKGILAFRESFASASSLRPDAQLGLDASVSNAGSDEIGRPTRAMVTTNAPGSSGGINLASISRNVGGGGPGMGGVAVSRVASSIGSGGDGYSNRPMAGSALAGRTDEEIQIVFDRYKAALYRLYNRELRKDPTLRGQIIIKLTIEPDGSVSFCTLQSSDMGAPMLAEQVIERVASFDFGAKEDIAAVTIIYPIDFLPAA